MKWAAIFVTLAGLWLGCPQVVSADEPAGKVPDKPDKPEKPYVMCVKWRDSGKKLMDVEVKNAPGLGDELVVHVRNLSGFLKEGDAKPEASRKIILYIDNIALPGVYGRPGGREMPPPDATKETDDQKKKREDNETPEEKKKREELVAKEQEGDLIFTLERTDGNKQVFTSILGKPDVVGALASDEACVRPVSLSVGYEGDRAIPTVVSGKKSLNLKIINRWWCWGWLLATIFVIVLLLLQASDMLKEGDKYSVGRTQMAWWTVILFGSFLFLWLVTGSANTISPTAVGLLGISATTFVAAAVIDKQTPAPTGVSATPDAANGNLAAGTYFYAVTSIYPNGESSPVRISAITGNAISKVVIAWTAPSGGAPTGYKIYRGIAQGQELYLAQVLSGINTYTDTGAAVPAGPLPGAAHVPAVVGGLGGLINRRKFLKDILSGDDGTISLYRFQLVLWTITVGFVFVYGVYRDLKMPDLDTTLLGLMGISSGAYLGFKYPDKKTT